MLNANLICRLIDLEADHVNRWLPTPGGLKLERLPNAAILGALFEGGRYNNARSQLYFSYRKALSSGRPRAASNFFAGNFAEFPAPRQIENGRL